MPIEDSMLLFEHGDPKEARYVLLCYDHGSEISN
jgi:hypothetical protein